LWWLRLRNPYLEVGKLQEYFLHFQEVVRGDFAPKQKRGLQAQNFATFLFREVVRTVFAPRLEDQGLWAKYFAVGDGLSDQEVVGTVFAPRLEH